VEYKEVPIDSIPSEALEHLEIAIPARTIINELIDEIYNEIKNEYMNEINHEVIA
jgi:predicted metalloenzyme YecM